MRFIALIIGGLAAILFTAWALGWALAPGQVASVGNVRTQWAESYKNDEALRATAGNICSARLLVTQATSDDERIQRQTQVIAQEANYRRIAATYDRTVRNGFEAKFVLPSDLPQRAAPMEDAVRAAC